MGKFLNPPGKEMLRIQKYPDGAWATQTEAHVLDNSIYQVEVAHAKE